ncbi:hypothetical protein AHAS_Ahas02G0000100 [Arachis hypogaea]
MPNLRLLNLCALSVSSSAVKTQYSIVPLSSLPSPQQSSLSVSHGLTSSLSQSLTSSTHLGRRHGPMPLHSLRWRQKQMEPHLVPRVVVVVIFLLLTVSISHLVSISPFPTLFIAGNRGNRSRWAGLRCRLLALSFAVSFFLAISFSFAVKFLRATRFVFLMEDIDANQSEENVDQAPNLSYEDIDVDFKITWT